MTTPLPPVAEPCPIPLLPLPPPVPVQLQLQLLLLLQLQLLQNYYNYKTTTKLLQPQNYYNHDYYHEYYHEYCHVYDYDYNYTTTTPTTTTTTNMRRRGGDCEREAKLMYTLLARSHISDWKHAEGRQRTMHNHET